MPAVGDDVRVSMLNVGWLTSAKGIWRRGEPFDELIRFPIPAYLIEIGDERILVDTGLHPGAAQDAQRHYETTALSAFELEQQASLADQLDVRTLTKVILTHLHFDHAGGLASLPTTVPIVIQRREWEAGRDDEAVTRNFYLPLDYLHIEEPVVLVDGDHDLLGDGSIQLLPTPGHTPGHQSVRVGSRLVLGGDVTHFASGLDDHRFPMFADDHHAQAASAGRPEALRDAGARPAGPRSRCPDSGPRPLLEPSETRFGPPSGQPTRVLDVGHMIRTGPVGKDGLRCDGGGRRDPCRRSPSVSSRRTRTPSIWPSA
jgi:N-acyl homoserine lactone hydrolase